MSFLTYLRDNACVYLDRNPNAKPIIRTRRLRTGWHGAVALQCYCVVITVLMIYHAGIVTGVVDIITIRITFITIRCLLVIVLIGAF